MSFTPENFTVWAEIPVMDIDRAIAFYNEVFDIELTKDETGPNPMAMFPTSDPKSGVAGHLYPGKPAPEGAGPTIHFAQVLSEPISIPSGRFAYCLDPDGNSIGLFSR